MDEAAFCTKCTCHLYLKTQEITTFSTVKPTECHGAQSSLNAADYENLSFVIFSAKDNVC